MPEVVHPLQNPDAELNSNLSRKTEGTCTWIQNTEEFRLLLEGMSKTTFGSRENLVSPHSNPSRGYLTDSLVWVPALGTGKSVLLSYLVHTTRKNSRNHPVLYFFCKAGSSETSIAAAIMANLIDQLVMQTGLESLLNILSKGRD